MWEALRSLEQDAELAARSEVPIVRRCQLSDEDFPRATSDIKS